jgi:hypothetical protein
MGQPLAIIDCEFATANGGRGANGDMAQFLASLHLLLLSFRKLNGRDRVSPAYEVMATIQRWVCDAYAYLLPSLDSPYRISSAFAINYMQTCLLRATTLFPCVAEQVMTGASPSGILAKWSVTLIDGTPRVDACWMPVPSIHDAVLQLANRALGRVRVRARCRVVH